MECEFRASSYFAAELRLGLEIDGRGPLRETNEDGLKFWMSAVNTDKKTDCERCCVLFRFFSLCVCKTAASVRR